MNKLKALISVCRLGADPFQRFSIGWLYVQLFVKKRMGKGSAFAEPRRVRIHLDACTYDFYIGSVLDIHVMREIFVDKQYAHPQDETCELVIDLGANIGATVVYFAHTFTKARIIAVEPNPVCMTTLRKNAAQFGERVTVVEKAVSDSEGAISFYLNDEHWSASTVHRRGAEKPLSIPCVTLGALCAEFGIDRIPYLKCDIEGSEFSVFPPFDTSRINLCVCEVHPKVAGKSVDDLIAMFPSHRVVRRESIGPHEHVELAVEN